MPILDDQYSDEGPSFQATTFFHSKNCDILVDVPDTSCVKCEIAGSGRCSSVRGSQVRKALPLKDKAPLSACTKERLVATVQHQRLVSKDLESKAEDLKKEIEENSVAVGEKLEKDLLTILADISLDQSPHVKLFWEQQKILLSSSFGHIYHPQLIRFCLSIHAKFPAAYKELRELGILILPSERTLHDYRNFFKPKPGLNPENICKLQNLPRTFFNTQRYVIVVFDEIKIQSQLV